MIATGAQILLKLLQDGNIVGTSANATTTKWAGFRGPLPAEPKRAIGFIDFGAEQQSIIQRSNFIPTFWRVQVMIRGLDYDSSGQHGNRIDDYLRRVGRPASVTVSGLPGLGNVYVTVNTETFEITYIKPYTRLAYLAKNDEDDTHLWVLNERFNVTQLAP